MYAQWNLESLDRLRWLYTAALQLIGTSVRVQTGQMVWVACTTLTVCTVHVRTFNLRDSTVRMCIMQYTCDSPKCKMLCFWVKWRCYRSTYVRIYISRHGVSANVNGFTATHHSEVYPGSCTAESRALSVPPWPTHPPRETGRWAPNGTTFSLPDLQSCGLLLAPPVLCYLPLPLPRHTDHWQCSTLEIGQTAGKLGILQNGGD